MKQLERLKYIYSALSVSPQTIESLQNSLKNNAVTVSNRQLYRDLNDVGHFLLRDGERLEQRSLEFNRKVWLLNKDTDAISLTNYDIDTYLMGRATMPIGLINGRGDSIKKIQALLANHFSNSKIEYNANWDGTSIVSTHFYEITAGKHLQNCLSEMIWAASHRRSVEIISYDGDAVSLYKSLQFPFKFNPIKLIYHRGSFFVAGTIAATKQCLVLDTIQIKDYQLSNETFPVKQVLLSLEKNLRNRFGVSQNVDDDTYQMILEFNATTGKYVQTFFWHNSQKFEELSNGNCRLTFTCGINRELLGWIYQWMGDVKIIEPAILKYYYEEHLKLIQHTQYSDVFYSNITQPK